MRFHKVTFTFQLVFLIVSVLQLSSVNLPGGELRRRSAEDELSMRNYLQEGDLVS